MYTHAFLLFTLSTPGFRHLLQTKTTPCPQMHYQKYSRSLKDSFSQRNPDYSRNYTVICTTQQQQGHRTFLFIYSTVAGTVANFLFALLASIFTLISTRGFHIFGSSIVSNYKAPAKKKGISKATNH